MTYLRKQKFYKIIEETSLPIKLWTLHKIEQFISAQIWVLHSMDVDRSLCHHKWVSHLSIKGVYMWVLVKFIFCLNLNCDGWPQLTGKSPHSCSVTPPSLLLSMMLCAVRYLFSQLGSVGLAFSFPASCPPSAHFLGQGETLTMCRHCSTIAKTLVSYQHWFGHISKTAILSAVKKVDSIRAKSSAILELIFSHFLKIWSLKNYI